MLHPLFAVYVRVWSRLRWNIIRDGATFESGVNLYFVAAQVFEKDLSGLLSGYYFSRDEHPWLVLGAG
jgi:hypothetical protein